MYSAISSGTFWTVNFGGVPDYFRDDLGRVVKGKYSEILIFPLLIHGAINAGLGDVLGGSGGGFGRFWGMFWEVLERFVDVKNL